MTMEGVISRGLKKPEKFMIRGKSETRNCKGSRKYVIVLILAFSILFLISSLSFVLPMASSADFVHHLMNQSMMRMGIIFTAIRRVLINRREYI